MRGRIVAVIIGPGQLMALSKVTPKQYRDQMSRILNPVDQSENRLIWREAGERRWIKIVSKEPTSCGR